MSGRRLVEPGAAGQERACRPGGNPGAVVLDEEVEPAAGVALRCRTYGHPHALPAPLARVVEQVAREFQEIAGIAAASDVIAMTAMRVLADRNIRVPDQIPVVGYDDLPLAMQTVPRITTVRQEIAAGARAMVQALFARIGGEDAPGVVMPPLLIERDSA